MIDDTPKLSGKKTQKSDFEFDRTYATTRNIGSEYYSQRLAEVGKKIPYPATSTKPHKARSAS